MEPNKHSIVLLADVLAQVITQTITADPSTQCHYVFWKGYLSIKPSFGFQHLATTFVLKTFIWIYCKLHMYLNFCIFQTVSFLLYFLHKEYFIHFIFKLIFNMFLFYSKHVFTKCKGMQLLNGSQYLTEIG